MAHHIVVLPSKRIGVLGELSVLDPSKVFLIVPKWSGAADRNTWLKASVARDGAVFSLPLRLAQLIAIFGARPDYTIDNLDLQELIWGDDEDGGPDNAMNCLSSVVSQYRHALRRLGLRIHGIHHGWRMDAVEPADVVTSRHVAGLALRVPAHVINSARVA